MPGFGLTTVPEDFNYTFDNLAAVISAWILSLDLSDFVMYIFDYGAPVGLRFAIEHPDTIKAIVSQNGNAYNEGFGEPFWKPVFNLWNSSNAEAEREVIKKDVLSLAATEYQYTEGFPKADYPLRNPESWTFDYLLNIAGENNTQHQLDLFYDYRTNPGTYYAKFQEYFRHSKVPILAVWGKGDPAFIPPGAEAYKKDSPGAVVRFVDAGHFALETKRWEIARIMKGLADWYSILEV